MKLFSADNVDSETIRENFHQKRAIMILKLKPVSLFFETYFLSVGSVSTTLLQLKMASIQIYQWRK